jgi:tetratricopeptide (TPR) repeat protein
MGRRESSGAPLFENKQMKLPCSIAISFAILAGQGMAQPSELAAGRASYRDGEFQQAVGHFRRAILAQPLDAESHYWIGRSYETLADIAGPFGGRYHGLARTYLTKATELAPDRSEYRRELFDFLLDSTNFSRSEQRQAFAILVSSAESDPEYPALRSRFEAALKASGSINSRLARLFLVAPQAAVGVVSAWR